MQSSGVLSVARDAADRMGLERPSTLFAPNDYEGNTNDRKILQAIIGASRFLASSFDWQRLRKELLVTVPANTASAGIIPADLLRWVPGTGHNRTRGWPLAGPLSPVEWQEAQLPAGRYCSLGGAFTIRGSQLYMTPMPATEEMLAFEYISGAIAATPGLESAPIEPGWRDMMAPDEVPGGWRDMMQGTPVSVLIPKFAADTDLCLWDDELMILGAMWQFRMSERLDYAPDESAFRRAMRSALAMESHGAVVSMAPTPVRRTRGTVYY